MVGNVNQIRSSVIKLSSKVSLLLISVIVRDLFGYLGNSFRPERGP